MAYEQNSLDINKILSMPPLIETIKRRSKPVLLYGMGNGAELTAEYLAKNGIAVSGVFASSGFVRGQKFFGERVMTVSEAEERFGDFTAVLSFALEGEKRSVAYDLAKNHFLVCPSVCPFGGVYDAHFVRDNAYSLSWLYDRLSDDGSKKSLIRLLSFAVTGDIEYTKGSVFHLPKGYISHSGIHVDIGAYDGTTALEYMKNNPNCRQVTAFEPDAHAFERLRANTDGKNVICVNAAVTDRDGEAGFSSKGSRASALGGDTIVKTVSLDGYFGCRKVGDSCDVGSIRIDGEGAEDAILSGGVNLIYNCRPAVCAAVYHRAEDIISIPRWLDYQLGGCELYLEVKPYIPAFDVFIYAIS